MKANPGEGSAGEYIGIGAGLKGKLPGFSARLRIEGRVSLFSIFRGSEQHFPARQDSPMHFRHLLR